MLRSCKLIRTRQQQHLMRIGTVELKPHSNMLDGHTLRQYPALVGAFTLVVAGEELVGVPGG